MDSDTSSNSDFKRLEVNLTRTVVQRFLKYNVLPKSNEQPNSSNNNRNGSENDAEHQVTSTPDSEVYGKRKKERLFSNNSEIMAFFIIFPLDSNGMRPVVILDRVQPDQTAENSVTAPSKMTRTKSTKSKQKRATPKRAAPKPAKRSRTSEVAERAGPSRKLRSKKK